jgi:hypothetical protein
MLSDGYDPKTSVQLYPMPMGRFGMNPWQEPMYRIVLAESRRFLVHGKKFGVGASRAAWMPLYPHIANEIGQNTGVWVLEKWIDAFAFTRMTAAEWNRDPDMLATGPYPSRGEYVMIGNLPIKPADTNIEKLIGMVNAGTKYSWAEKLAACRLRSDSEEAGKKSLMTDIIRDALPVAGTEPLVGYGGHRGTKTAPILKSANELHLPRPTNITQANGGARMFTPAQARRFGFPRRKMEPVGITL